VLVVLPLVGRYYDRLYRTDPAKALSLIGKVVLPVAFLVPIQYFMPNAVLWAVFSVPSVVLLLTGFSMIGPVLTSVAPYRCAEWSRGGGPLCLLHRGDRGSGPRRAARQHRRSASHRLIIMIPSTLDRGVLDHPQRHFIRNDLSLVVVELQEEMEEHRANRRTRQTFRSCN
jgi:hypothetical protein